MAEELTITAQRMRARMEEIGLKQEDLADAIGVTQGTISLILTGKTQRSRLLPKIATQLSVNLSWLSGESDELINMFDQDSEPISEDELAKIALGRSDKQLFHQPRYLPIGAGSALEEDQKSFTPVPAEFASTGKSENLVGVREIDLTFGMGATYMDVPVTTQVRQFSREWLRQYTHADPDHLFFAQGIGNSMEPYIHSHDLLLIDTSQNSIRLSDQVWAVAYGNCGSIKRIRPMADGSIKIMSDNPTVSDEVAHDGELHVIGRVVAIIRRI